MDDDGFRPPSRERFREERRAIRAADRRRKMIGVPVVLMGLGLVSAGAYVFTQTDDTNAPVDVQGTSVERSTTTTSTTTTSTTTTTTTTTLPPTTLAPTTTAKPKPKPKPTAAPTTAAPVDTTAAPATAPPAA